MTSAIVLKDVLLALRDRRVLRSFLVYLVMLSVVLLALVMNARASRNAGDGRDAEHALFWLQMALLLLGVPGISASAISLERERQTLDMLTTTLLTETQIIGGKLLSAVARAWLLLAAGLPVMVAAMTWGGVSLEEFAVQYLTLALVAVPGCLAGIFYSSREKTTRNASLMTFGMLIFLGCVLVPLSLSLGWALGYAMWGYGGSGDRWWGALLYPVAAWNPGLPLLFEQTPGAATSPHLLRLLTVASWTNGALICLFLFFKSCHSLRPRAAWVNRLNVLLALGAIGNMAAWAWSLRDVLAGAPATPSVTDVLMRILWIGLSIIELMVVGMLLPTPVLAAPSEQARFTRRSWRWLPWLALAAGNYLLVSALGLEGGPLAATLLLALLAAWRLLFGPLAATLAPRRFHGIYYIALLLCLVPMMLGLGHNGVQSSVWPLDPFTMAGSVWTPVFAPLPTLLSIGAMALFGALLNGVMLRRRRREAGALA